MTSMLVTGLDGALASASRCPFCRGFDDRVIAANSAAVAISDAYPVTAGHTLVIPWRHVADIFELSEDEARAAYRLVRTARELLQAGDPTIAGFNIGVNCGAAAGQTVAHAHVHLIPRRYGDAPDPRGGVRGVIAERMKY
jgi:ATP adenylyltransferase